MGIDWLQGTFPVHKVQEAVATVSEWLGVAKLGHGDKWYKSGGYRWESGAIVAWADDRPEAWLSLNGSTLALCPDVLNLLRKLWALQMHPTRVDLRADFPKQLLSLADVEAAAQAGEVVGYRRYNPVKPIKNMQTGEREGEGHYFGRRGGNGSGKFGRFYDKTLESKGKIDANRWEVEFSGAPAECVYEAISGADDYFDLARNIRRYLGRAIDFREKGSVSDRHIERRPRLTFWSRAIQYLGEAAMTFLRPKVKLQSTLEWFYRSYKNALGKFAVVAAAQGYDGVGVVMEFCKKMLVQGMHDTSGVEAGPLAMHLDIFSLLGAPQALRY